MQGILEIYGDYRDEGVMSRKITEGKEIELVRSYISYRKEQFNNKNCSCNKNLAIFLEPKVDNAYPDIVFVEYNPESYENWNETRNNLLKEDLKILYHIYATRGQNASELVLQLGVSWKGLMLTIERLNDAGLIYRENQQWQVKDISKISTYGIEAVEAKMNQWNQVLQQSIINRNFASESYVLSVVKSTPQNATLAKFKKFGIGVCLKDGDDFNIIKQAQKTEIPSNFNSIFFNEWIGRILNAREKKTYVIG